MSNEMKDDMGEWADLSRKVEIKEPKSKTYKHPADMGGMG